MIDSVAVTRYVLPLREGGSLPGVVEGDDLGTYVCKFRGAGQGVRVLAAEVIAAGIAGLVGIPTPRLVALDLDPEIARYEADEEVQDLITASPGLNLGIDFLPGAFGYDGTLPTADGAVGARVLWLDAFLANVDRTWRNPNLLVWHDELWAIYHGASLYFHHAWAGGLTDPARFAAQAWDPAGHVMLRWADRVAEVDTEVTARLDRQAVAAVVAEVPDAWLPPAAGDEDPERLRTAYVDFLLARLGTRQWLPPAEAA